MVAVVIKALNILEFIAEHGKEPVQLFKIAEHMGLGQATTVNIIQSLVRKNYVEQLGRKTGYRLGAAAFRLVGSPSYSQDMTSAAKELMEELSKQLNETALLAVIRNNKRVIVHMVETNQPLQVKTVMEADVYDTSTGRLLMAFLSPKELEGLIKIIGLPTKKVWPGAETRAALDIALQEIRKDKFAQVLSVYHTVGFAVPVYKNKEVVASLSVFVPESRYTEAHKDKLFKHIRKYAKLISDRLT